SSLANRRAVGSPVSTEAVLVAGSYRVASRTPFSAAFTAFTSASTLFTKASGSGATLIVSVSFVVFLTVTSMPDTRSLNVLVGDTAYPRELARRAGRHRRELKAVLAVADVHLRRTHVEAGAVDRGDHAVEVTYAARRVGRDGDRVLLAPDLEDDVAVGPL